jgi:predicted ATPase
MAKAIQRGMEASKRAGGAVAALTAGTALGPYRVEAVLARGGMGVVYRATEVALGRPVALKVINPALAALPGFSERFKRESRFAASVDHPHIVPVYAAGECDGVVYIAMRLVEGTDLRSLIASHGPLDPARAADIVAYVASALDAAHARGFVHRDVKPANVLIAERASGEHVYLTDFGLSKRTGSVSALTASGHWVGTVDYVAPEQIRGDPVGKEADVYGLGCVLYEALTGEVPFPRENDLATLWAHASSAPPSASEAGPDVPSGLSTVAQRAMAKQPEDRYATAGELGAAAVAAARGDHRSGGIAPLAGLSRLPAPLTRTVGREAECAEVTALVRGGSARLVTLLGPGGVGKSRLALEAARAVERDFGDGAWFVELAATTDADNVAGAVASALAVTPVAGETPEQALIRFLAPRHALLVLDNFEHVLPAARLVSELLRTAGALTVLATSRAPLDIQPEHRTAVEPLDLPSGGTPGDVKRSPACTLFLERAQSHGATLAVDRLNAGAIAAICRRLDGLPLAIELAAARAPLLEPSELNDLLANALEALGTGARDAPARQRTLRATIDWSCRLLEPREADAFARFAAFAGGAGIDSAREVTGADLDALEGLVDKQLLLRRPGPAGSSRLLMLETVREYARARLAARPDAHHIHERHCNHYLALAERAEPQIYTHGEKEWLPKLDADADNLRAAFDWSLGHGLAAQGLRLAGLLHPFWTIRGRSPEGIEWVRRAKEAAGDEAPLGDRARAQRAYVHLLIANGAHYDWKGAREEAEAQAGLALDLSRQAGNPAGIADALLVLSSFEATDSAPPRPGERALAGEALIRAREAGDDRLVAFALMTRALAIPLEEAASELEDAAAALRKIGDSRHLVWLYSNAAYNALMEGIPERALPMLDMALPLARDLGYPSELALACGNTGLAALFTGDLDRAQEAFDEQLRICSEQVSWLAAEALVGFAAIAARRGDPELAARLMGAATATGALADDDVSVRLQRGFFMPARALLGEDAWCAAEAEGARLSADEAIAMALETEPTGTPPTTPG